MKVIRIQGGRPPVTSSPVVPEVDPDDAALRPNHTSEGVVVGAQARRAAGLLPLSVLRPEPVREERHYGGGSASGSSAASAPDRRSKKWKR